MIDPLYPAYLSLTFALVITPGATTAVVVRHTLAGGWRGGLAAAAGAAGGNSTHALAAGLGLAVVLARVPIVLVIVRIAGGVYLAWLGARSALRVFRREAVPVSADAGPTRHHGWREGVMVNLLYLAVVPSFLPHPASRGSYAQLAATHVGLAFVVHSLWVLALDRLRHLLARPAARLTLEAITAGALWLLAGRVLSSAIGGRG